MANIPHIKNPNDREFFQNCTKHWPKEPGYLQRMGFMQLYIHTIAARSSCEACWSSEIEVPPGAEGDEIVNTIAHQMDERYRSALDELISRTPESRQEAIYQSLAFLDGVDTLDMASGNMPKLHHKKQGLLEELVAGRVFHAA